MDAAVRLPCYLFLLHELDEHFINCKYYLAVLQNNLLKFRVVLLNYYQSSEYGMVSGGWLYSIVQYTSSWCLLFFR